jgi:drug/metabolite transporter (DMT)-like permease
MPTPGLRAYTALGSAAVFWGLSFVATKVALESFPTFTLVFARFALSSCLFLGLVAYRGLPYFSGREHGKVLLTALFEPGFYFVFETLGLRLTTAAKAALIIATIPLVVLLLAGVFLGERVSLRGLLGVGLSLLGIAVLVVGDSRFSWTLGEHLLGDLLIFGAVVSAALYMVCARDLGRNHSARDITSMQTFYGAIFYAPAFFWELPTVEWARISSRSVAALVYLTLFATVAAFLCYNYALTKVPASRASVFINAIPVVTALGAWALLGERLTLIQAGGGFLVLCGVYLASRPTSRGARLAWRQSIT